MVKKKIKQYDFMKEIKDVLKSVKDFDKDGLPDMFDCAPKNPKKQGMEHQYSFSSTGAKRIKTVKMAPKKFLQETYKEQYGENVDFKDKKKYKDYIKDLKQKPSRPDSKHATTVEAIKEKIRSKKESVPIGFLEYDKGQPSGHEGRHTAIAAEESNIKKIPVTVSSYKREEEPSTSKLPLHRKQYGLHSWKSHDESEEEYKERKTNIIARQIEINKGKTEWLKDDKEEQDKEVEEGFKHTTKETDE